jgi:hypothetical protein
MNRYSLALAFIFGLYGGLAYATRPPEPISQADLNQLNDWLTGAALEGWAAESDKNSDKYLTGKSITDAIKACTPINIKSKDADCKAKVDEAYTIAGRTLGMTALTTKRKIEVSGKTYELAQKLAPAVAAKEEEERRIQELSKNALHAEKAKELSKLNPLKPEGQQLLSKLEEDKKRRQQVIQTVQAGRAKRALAAAQTKK